jgi:hypothetical protein
MKATPWSPSAAILIEADCLKVDFKLAHDARKPNFKLQY